MDEISEDINSLHSEVAALFDKNLQDEDIIKIIVSKGYEKHYAEMVLDNVREDISDRKNFRKTLFYGLGFLASGILVTIASKYFFISRGAIFYLFYWGLIVTGISIIARAFIIFKK